jgi:hypothetical protein
MPLSNAALLVRGFIPKLGFFAHFLHMSLILLKGKLGKNIKRAGGGAIVDRSPKDTGAWKKFIKRTFFIR